MADNTSGAGSGSVQLFHQHHEDVTLTDKKKMFKISNNLSQNVFKGDYMLYLWPSLGQCSGLWGKVIKYLSNISRVMIGHYVWTQNPNRTMLLAIRVLNQR